LGFVKKVVATGKDVRVSASQFMQAKNAYLIQGFFYRPKFTEISEISILSKGSDKI